jgi:adenylate kinase family enzyme
MRNITITGPRSVGKSTISKLLSKKLKLKYISSDELGEKLSKNFGGLDKAIKSGKIKELIRKKGYTEILKQYIDFLYKREAKRSHFKNVDKEQLLERTKRRYPQQRDILLKNADKIIYVKDLKQRDLGAMIIRVVSSDNTTPVRLS